MAEIRVEFKRLNAFSEQQKVMSSKVGKISENLRILKSSIDWDIKKSSSIDTRLSDLCREVENCSHALGAMAVFIKGADRAYEKCENENLVMMGNVDRNSGVLHGSSDPGNLINLLNAMNPFNLLNPFSPFRQDSLLNPIIVNELTQLHTAWEWVGTTLVPGNAFISDHLMFNGVFSPDPSEKNSLTMGIGAKNEFGSSWSEETYTNAVLLAPWLAATGTYESKYGSLAGNTEMEAAYDFISGDVFLRGKGDLEGSLVEQSGVVQAGLLTAQGALKFVNAKAEGEAKLALMQDGKINPKIAISGNAEASVLKGEAGVQFGSEDNNIYTEAEGKVLTASAEGEAELSINGAALKGEMVAALAQGEAESGFELFGYKVGISVEGTAGSIGLEGGFSTTTDEVSFGFGAHALLGGAFEVKISTD